MPGRRPWTGCPSGGETLRHRDLFNDLALFLPGRIGCTRADVLAMSVRQITRLVLKVAK